MQMVARLFLQDHIDCLIGTSNFNSISFEHHIVNLNSCALRLARLLRHVRLARHLRYRQHQVEVHGWALTFKLSVSFRSVSRQSLNMLHTEGIAPTGCTLAWLRGRGQNSINFPSRLTTASAARCFRHAREPSATLTGGKSLPANERSVAEYQRQRLRTLQAIAIVSSTTTTNIPGIPNTTPIVSAWETSGGTWNQRRDESYDWGGRQSEYKSL